MAACSPLQHDADKGLGARLADQHPSPLAPALLHRGDGRGNLLVLRKKTPALRPQGTFTRTWGMDVIRAARTDSGCFSVFMADSSARPVASPRRRWRCGRGR